jgi:hypothetical protein
MCNCGRYSRRCTALMKHVRALIITAVTCSIGLAHNFLVKIFLRIELRDEIFLHNQIMRRKKSHPQVAFQFPVRGDQSFTQ